MKKYLWLILIVSVLMACTLTVAAVTGGETPVVYLNGEDGVTAGDGSSATSPVKTLADAYAALGSNGGTIVLCGDISVGANSAAYTGNSKFSATSGSILYTGKDPDGGTEYDPVIKITGSGEATLVEFFTQTEFSYVTFNATTAKTPYLVSGPSLTIGEGVVFQKNGSVLTSTTSDTFGIRVGSYVSKINGKYTQKSGTIGSVYGGATKGAGTSEINITGTAKVLVRLEAGGRGAKVDTSTINISGQAEVNTLLFGGYQSSVGSVTANISGGKVNSVVTSRETTAGATVDNATLTISDSAKVGSITLDSRNANGNNTLTISNDQTLTGNFGAHWDTINIGSFAEVTVDAAYDGTGTVKVDGLLTLNANMNDQTAVDALATANTGSGRIVSSGAAGEPVTVYLDGSDGVDTNDGTGTGDAVKTLARAYELMDGNGGTIVICGDLEIASSDVNNTSDFSVRFGNVVYTGKDPVTAEIYPVKITIVDGTKTDLVQIFTPTVFEYLTFDACTNNSTMFVTGRSLTFGEGMTFLRDGRAITDVAKDQIVVRLGSKTEKIAPTFIMKSGVISSVYGGNQFMDSGKTTVKISGDSQILVRLECGGKDHKVDQMDLTVSDNVYVNMLNLTGYSNGDLGISNTTITGGYIAKIWGQRDSNDGVTNNLAELNVTISGDTYFEAIDLGGINITGTATLTIDDLADDLVFTMFDEYWDKIVIKDDVKLHLAGEYPAGVPLEVGQNSILYLDPRTNTAIPTYTKTGDGSGLVVLDEHNHTLTHVEAYCGSENGVIEHWRCDEEGCPGKGNCYADADGLVPVSKEGIKTDGNHTLEELDSACTGARYYRCKVCGGYFEDLEGKNEITEQEYQALGGHKVVKVDVKAPTCVEDGVLEAHWHCENCNWNFRDEACTDLIKYSVIDPKTGHHELKPVDAKAPTCTEDGCIAHYACEDCGKTYTSALYFRSRLPLSAEKVTVKARHTLTYVDPVPATDDAHGTAGYWTCKVDTCANYGKRFADEEGAQAVTDADLLTHKLTKVDAKEATATEPGNKAYWVCASCDKIYADAEGKTEITLASTVIPATGEEQKPPVESEPEETQKPTTPADPDGPDTGDHGAVLLAAVMLILSAVGVLAATELKRRWR